MRAHELVYTRHARTRAQQRSIPPVAVELVQRYGRCEYQGQQHIFHLDKKGRDRVRTFLGRQLYRSVSEFLDIYVVTREGGAVVTTAHRCQRRERDRARNRGSKRI